jgi:uncharacterized membrane protein
MRLGVLQHGIGGDLGIAVVILTIVLLVERQLLLAHGGEIARATAARQSRAAAVLGLMTLVVIVLRMVQLFNP